LISVSSLATKSGIRNMFDHLSRFTIRDLGFADAKPVETEKPAFVPVQAAVFAVQGGLQPWQAALLAWARQRATWVAQRPSRWQAAERIHSN
jgi:hypothetical protein